MKFQHKKLGAAFTEEVLKVTQRSGHFRKSKLAEPDWKDLFLPNYQEISSSTPISPWRLAVLASLFLVVFFGLFLRLFHLQIVQGKENRVRADFNRVQVKIIHAPRGVIYDRNDRILAESNPGFRLGDKFINRDAALILEAKDDPVVKDLETDTIRSYPFGDLTSHLLGYVGQISAEELKDPRFSGYERSSTTYRIGDRIGRDGLEQAYEAILRGIDGAEIIEVDAAGQKLRTLRKLEPVSGKNLHLSLDVDLQKVVFEALQKMIGKVGSCCGAAIAEDPKTGEVLALVSLPTYDANVFTNPERNEEITRYVNDSRSPLLNRVISGTYQPGSTFKIITVLAGLTSGKISPLTEFEDTGEMFVGPYRFSNWYFTQYGGKEGMLDLVKALKRSNDIYFYHVGGLVGEKVLGETAKKVGLGQKLGIDLPGEVSGLIPTGEWKKKAVGEIWYPGDTLHMAIGQGFILATPLQILTQTSFIASDGKLIRPRLVSKVTSPEGLVVKQFPITTLSENLFKKEEIGLIKKGLAQVPKEGGTAWPFFNFSIPTAGKTGTAEFGDPKGKTHAWYTSYAPIDDPKIALTILLEGGGEGSSVAAPVAKEIYTWYFNPDKKNLNSLDFYPASDSAKKLGE